MYKIVNFARNDKRLSNGAVSLLEVITRYSNLKEDKCLLTNTNLAEKVGLHRSNIIRSLNKLEKLSYINTVYLRSRNGKILRREIFVNDLEVVKAKRDEEGLNITSKNKTKKNKKLMVATWSHDSRILQHDGRNMRPTKNNIKQYNITFKETKITNSNKDNNITYLLVTNINKICYQYTNSKELLKVSNNQVILNLEKIDLSKINYLKWNKDLGISFSKVIEIDSVDKLALYVQLEIAKLAALSVDEIKQLDLDFKKGS